MKHTLSHTHKHTQARAPQSGSTLSIGRPSSSFVVVIIIVDIAVVVANVVAVVVVVVDVVVVVTKVSCSQQRWLAFHPLTLVDLERPVLASPSISSF